MKNLLFTMCIIWALITAGSILGVVVSALEPTVSKQTLNCWLAVLAIAIPTIIILANEENKNH